MCSFHGCVHNLTLNGVIFSLDRLAESDRLNGTRLPVALCPADVDNLTLPCHSNDSCHGNWSSGCNQSQSLNPCSSSPCAANSTCVPTTSSYACLCPPGSTGNYCELAVICQLACLHGGTCTWTSEGARCRCPVGRTGSRCEVDVDECVSSPCRNGGTCYESGQTVQAFGPGYLCFCRPSYHGVNCQRSVCDSAPCRHAGRCLPDDGDYRGYRCECLPGFEGPLCERDLRLCASSPCHGNSTCINTTSTPNDYTCLCSPGFTGKHKTYRLTPYETTSLFWYWKFSFQDFGSQFVQYLA